MLEESKRGVDDILNLSDYSESSLTHTLRVRYAKNTIYTSVGPILVSINPYKWIKKLTDEDVMKQYEGTGGKVRSGVVSACVGRHVCMCAGTKKKE